VFKVLFFLKRKDGITHDQFREHFENVHVKIADKYFTHLMTRYERKYINNVSTGMHAGRAPSGFAFDCISEWTLPSEKTLEEIWGMFAVPAIGKEFYDDEENFLHREATMVIKCQDADIRGGDR
jgi:hypothetical protein